MAELKTITGHFLVGESKIDIPNDLKHFCLDKNPVAELWLWFYFSEKDIVVSSLPDIYGFKSMSQNCYYFLDKSQVDFWQLDIHCKE